MSDTQCLTAHLLGITDKGGWSLQRDLDLLTMSVDGVDVHIIADLLNMHRKAVLARFDALTGLHDHAETGVKARRWMRAEVLVALQEIAAKRVAA